MASRRPDAPPSRLLRAVLLGLALLVTPLVTGCNKDVRDSDIQFISLPELRQRQLDAEQGQTARVLIIDPRSPARFARAHLPGAQNIRLKDVPEEDPKDPRLERFDRLVVYGDNPASAVAKAMAKRLIYVGYGRKTVRWFSGGMAQWAGAGLPIDYDRELYNAQPNPDPNAPDEDEPSEAGD
ncbi:MAG: rhodanese-like domain-containing protein [Planctomycetota bacterium]